ncbi:MAG TPA: heat-inducible transcriptional repressor HrcA [Polyangiaceae bacterium]
MELLNKRERSVLYAVITDFIATGEPVGSRTLTRKYGFDLSPATIRNVLADLEEAGYLTQPHTSAGRAPTERAFRLFIDALMRVRNITDDEARQISEVVDGPSDGTSMLHEVGRMLSQISGAPAILLKARGSQRTVVKLRFIPTRPDELLSVAVFSDGTVENRFIHLEHVPSDSQLERVHNLLEEVVVGKTLLALREYFQSAVHRQRDEVRSLVELSSTLISAAVEGADLSHDVIISGHARLLDQSENEDPERLKQLMLALEDREQLITLLDLTLVSDQVQVFLGSESTRLAGYPLSLVAARYSWEHGEPRGAVGVVGPTRMDYPHLVPLVGATAEAMSAALLRRRALAGGAALGSAVPANRDPQKADDS